MPSKTLSTAAAATTREELVAAAAMQAAAQQQLTLRVLDISPGTNLAYFLREWSGSYTLAEAPDGASATIIFAKESTMKSCLGVLGGGVRGVFRIERPPPPSEMLRPNRPATAAAALLLAPPTTSTLSGVSSGGQSSTFTSARRAAAAVSGPPLVPTDRWLVVQKGGSKKTAAAPHASPGPGGPISLRSASGQDGATHGPSTDPWADEQRSEVAAVAVPAAEDWETALEDQLDVQLGLNNDPVEGLPVDGNKWHTLGDNGEEEGVEEGALAAGGGIQSATVEGVRQSDDTELETHLGQCFN